MRVALVHDWLTGMRGGERCLEVFCELFPAADIFTLVHVPGSVSPVIERHRIITSFLQRLPAAATQYRHYLPLFPTAIQQFDLSDYALVLSLSHCVAKGARPTDGALHICYCLTPMRYVWDRYADYFGPDSPILVRMVMPPVAAALRRWDRRSSRRVHEFVAISRYVAARIERYYGRAATVIHPPVDVRRFHVTRKPRGDFYLVVSALVPYKRIDLALAAANQLGRRLVVVGTGPEAKRLEKMAGPTVEFLGWRSDDEVADLYAECRAVLFPGVEDFGIVPLEAMAAGRPVIAFAGGGVLETIVPLDGGEDPPTGVLFPEQTVAGLVGAIQKFEANADRFAPDTLRARAMAFDREEFRRRLTAHLDARLARGKRC